MTTSDLVDNQNVHADSEDGDIKSIPLEEMELSCFYSNTDDEGDEVLTAVRQVLSSNNKIDVQTSCLRSMELLDLGRLAKGSLLFDTKQKSFQQLWTLCWLLHQHTQQVHPPNLPATALHPHRYKYWPQKKLPPQAH